VKTPRRLSQLTPNERNPRRISPRALDALRKSCAEFGDLSGFVFNRRTQRLIGAHQRHSILPPDSEIVISEQLKEPDALGTVARGLVKVGADRIPYREVDWPAAKEKAAMIAANKHGGEFIADTLSDLLHEIEAEGTDLDVTGFFGEALAVAKKEAYDSLSRLEAIVRTEQPAAGEKAAPGATAAPTQPRAATLLAFTLTTLESARWAEVKKQLGERDDKAAFNALLKARLDP